ncbi:MAG TPA: glycine zipper family protein [Aromatoleum sp.]|uniref:glycine zipper family protein n=1 Tax=Aromatoleum sp. TaxID=2307007 RepID=UPI002B47EB87|nr:glycine zipper family protein [Aromatoleum sp.]HJV25648.1 glycine zipper family protein [Aromatoleum sp.]
MSLRIKIVPLAAVLALAGCASIPTGPSVLVLPGTGKSFNEFRADERDCREYAFESIGGRSAQQRANEAGVRSAVVGTAIGAAAGAAIDGGRGAAVGAGSGLLIGSAAGSDTAQVSGYGAQRRYDNAYIQCMYAAGHRVPVSGSYAAGRAERSRNSPPPPPAGSPPPPPPGAR